MGHKNNVLTSLMGVDLVEASGLFFGGRSRREHFDDPKRVFWIALAYRHVNPYDSISVLILGMRLVYDSLPEEGRVELNTRASRKIVAKFWSGPQVPDPEAKS